MRILRAASASGIALVLAFFAIAFARDFSEVEISKDLATGIALSIPYLWLLGAGFAAVLLFPLAPLADHTSPVFSFVIFLIAGFVALSYLSYLLLFSGAHGELPPIDTEPASELLMQILVGGSLGAVSAAVAWRSIRKSRRVDAA